MNRKIIIGVLGCCLAGALIGPRLQARQVIKLMSQSELDAFAGKMPDAPWNELGHAWNNEEARLFWFTDLERAKIEAKRSGKPILSLRMLGNLTDEYSCANSRFFRVLLYPQSDINQLMREKFVLHWKSERAVPVVTIDMGDGRVVKRTLTGNSAHYLLGESGAPLDVLPGLYSPPAFAKWLESGVQLFDEHKKTAPDKRANWLANFHRERIAVIWRDQMGGDEPHTRSVAQLAADTKDLAQQVEQSIKLNPLVDETVSSTSVVDAGVAAPMFMLKSLPEIPILNATNLFATTSSVRSEWIWGAPKRFQFEFDEATRERIRAMNPRLGQNVKRVVAPVRFMRRQSAIAAPATDPFERFVDDLEAVVAADTANNRFRMEIPIHALFASGQVDDLETLNRKLYDRLFQTPASDPWLGLGADGVFTGLQNGGLFERELAAKHLE